MKNKHTQGFTPTPERRQVAFGDHRNEVSLRLVWGFTLLEGMLVLTILIILSVMAVPLLNVFESESNLQSSTQGIVGTLRLAQEKTLASADDSQFGIFFDDATTSHQYTFFRGTSYASRTPLFDEIRVLPETVEFSGVNFGGGNEIVFNRVDGTTIQSGSISIRLRSDAARVTTIYVDDLGIIETASTTAPSDTARITDSRHVHFDYTRTIATSTEKLVLTFSVATQDIIIADNIQAGQIFWEGDVTDAGETQHIRIQTHRLNDTVLDTEFSIHRDLRFNTKPLTVDIDDSPDPDSGTLISYDADGITSKGTSIYASSSIWQ